MNQEYLREAFEYIREGLHYVSTRIYSYEIPRQSKVSWPKRPCGLGSGLFHEERLSPCVPCTFDYFTEGCGNPLLGREDEVPVPRLWLAISTTEKLLDGVKFEKLCATLEVKEKHAVGQSLRSYASTVLTQCKEAMTAIEDIQSNAVRKVNQICCDFVGVSDPERFQSIIERFNLETDLTFWGPLGGDEIKRKSLAAALRNGPPSVIELHPVFNPSDLSMVAQRYWTIQSDAGSTILGRRLDLARLVRKMRTFVEIVLASEICAVAAESKQGAAVEEGETNPSPLPRNQSLVLQTMMRFDASRLLSTEMIAAEMDTNKPLSRRTIGPCVKKLIGAGLAERPQGPRSGARLTLAGRKLARAIAD